MQNCTCLQRMEESITALQEAKTGDTFTCVKKRSEKQDLCYEWVQKMCAVLWKERNASSFNRSK